MKVVGLTGGIGSGKSTVAKMFEDLGVPVYYADTEAKRLMTESQRLRKNLIDLFGDKVYDESGLNREYLAAIVFNDKEKLEALNALVHPEVEMDFHQWMKKKRTPYIIQENPLIFEKNKQQEYDAVITVASPEKLRIERVMRRDGMDYNQVRARIANQLNQDIKVKNATYVIENSSGLDTCRIAVQAVHHHILSEIP